MGGGGSTYDYGFRIYNPQIARFLSVDPLTKEYPYYTPYQFAGNKPIQAIDLDGLEELDYRYNFIKNNGKIQLKNINVSLINPSGPRTINTSFTFDGNIYKANSQQTLHGRDRRVITQDGSTRPNQPGDFSGVTSLSQSEVEYVIGYGAFIIYDKYNGNVEQATLGESNALPKTGVELDFKSKAYELLGIPRQDLLEIDGTTYNANEAGNYLWGMLLEYTGSLISGNAYAEAGSQIQGRSDEPHEQRAINAGRAKAKEYLKDPKFKERILEKRLENRPTEDD